MSRLFSRESCNKKQILIFILSVLPVAVTLAVYRRLPDQIALNFGFDGSVNYDDKYHIWAIAGMGPMFGILLYVLPMIDPKKRNYDRFRGAYQTFQLLMQLFLLGALAAVLAENLRPGTVSVPAVICAMCGILLMAIGNMMPKFRQNFFCGFRSPWALSDEKVWNKTHRLGGKLFFAAGFVSFFAAFVPDETWKMILVFGPVMLASAIPYVMSYVWFRQLGKGKGRQEEHK